MYKITEDLKNLYPYAHSVIHGPGCDGIPDEGYSQTPPCPLAEFVAFGICVIERNCTQERTMTWVFVCILLNCVTEVRNLPTACLTCFLTTFKDSSLVNVYKRLV